MEKMGILYGIGVGPGDPELITVKTARGLKEVDVVFEAPFRLLVCEGEESLLVLPGVLGGQALQKLAGSVESS